MSANLLQTINTGLGRRTSQAPERVDFSKIATAVRIPNLIEIQRESYNRFLQMDLLPEEREATGLQAVFQSVFPISDFRGTATLDFVEYQIGNWQCKCGRLEGLNYLRANCKTCGSTIKVNPLAAGETLCHKCGTFNFVRPQLCENCGEPVGLKHKHDQQECQERGMSYSVPLKVKIRLTVFDKDPETNVSSIRDIKEEDVFFGEIPLMTQNGTFIINGTERVIVSQLHRSPGVFFERVAAQGYYLGKIIPYRGSWVEFEYDNKSLLHVRIDRKRKFYGTVFLRALGLKTDEQIIKAFYSQTLSKISFKDSKIFWEVGTGLKGMKLSYAIAKGGTTIVPQGRKVTESLFRELAKNKVDQVEVAVNDLEGAYFAADVIDMDTGEVLADANQEASTVALQRVMEAGIKNIEIFFPERDDAGMVIAMTLRKDPVKAQNDALLEIYR